MHYLGHGNGDIRNKVRLCLHHDVFVQKKRLFSSFWLPITQNDINHAHETKNFETGDVSGSLKNRDLKE